jgi:hypothetical protein
VAQQVADQEEDEDRCGVVHQSPAHRPQEGVDVAALVVRSHVLLAAVALPQLRRVGERRGDDEEPDDDHDHQQHAEGEQLVAEGERRLLRGDLAIVHREQPLDPLDIGQARGQRIAQNCAELRQNCTWT